MVLVVVVVMVVVVVVVLLALVELLLLLLLLLPFRRPRFSPRCKSIVVVVVAASSWPLLPCFMFFFSPLRATLLCTRRDVFNVYFLEVSMAHTPTNTLSVIGGLIVGWWLV